MSQSFVCGMRRFDKHRMNSLKTPEKGSHMAELEERLQQREAQNQVLSGIPATPHTTPVLSGTVHRTPPSPLVCPAPATGYTPWRTPSASASASSPRSLSLVSKPG